MPPLTANQNLLSVGIVRGSINTNGEGVPDIFDTGLVSAGGITANNFLGSPWYCSYAGILSQFKIRCTVVGTATKFRLGIYSVGAVSSTGRASPANLLAQTNDVIPAVDDTLVCQLSNNYTIRNNWYWLCILSDGTFTMDFINHTNCKVGLSMVGRDASRVINSCVAVAVSAGWTTMPLIAPVVGSGNQNTRPLYRAVYFS